MPDRTVLVPGEMRKAIADLITNVSRNLLGKGPESIKVSVGEGEVVIELAGFLTPIEKALTRNGRNYELVELIRDRLWAESADDFERLQQQFGVRVTYLRGTVDFANDRRTVIAGIQPL